VYAARIWVAHPRSCMTEVDSMAQDAIVLLKDDHREVRRIFREFRKAGRTRSGSGGRWTAGLSC
jgi:hypothetical protein